MYYNPESFLTKEILEAELIKYQWADSFSITDEDCTIDGIRVRLPNCTLFFYEGFESNMTAFISDPKSAQKKIGHYLI